MFYDKFTSRLTPRQVLLTAQSLRELAKSQDNGPDDSSPLKDSVISHHTSDFDGATQDFLYSKNLKMAGLRERRPSYEESHRHETVTESLSVAINDKGQTVLRQHHDSESDGVVDWSLEYILPGYEAGSKSWWDVNVLGISGSEAC